MKYSHDVDVEQVQYQHVTPLGPDQFEKSAAADVTRLLNDAAGGDSAATDELFQAVYDQLKKIARRRMASERPDHTLQATALVHEAYMRLIGTQDLHWNSRAHFFGAVAQAMRRILVEQARRKARPKHGGDRRRVEPDASRLAVQTQSDDVLGVDEAVGKLGATDPRKERIVNLRYFAGLTVAETARVLGVSVGTVEREWRFVKSWLQTELAEHAQD